MVHDLTARLAARGTISPPTRLRTAQLFGFLRRCAGASRAPVWTALQPPLVLAIACGTLAWALCAATAAVRVVVGIHPLQVGVAIARWTFLSAAAADLLHCGVLLEHARWAARRESARLTDPAAGPPPAA